MQSSEPHSLRRIAYKIGDAGVIAILAGWLLFNPGIIESWVWRAWLIALLVMNITVAIFYAIGSALLIGVRLTGVEEGE